jgi:hypothetical protein
VRGVYWIVYAAPAFAKVSGGIGGLQAVASPQQQRGGIENGLSQPSRDPAQGSAGTGAVSGRCGNGSSSAEPEVGAVATEDVTGVRAHCEARADKLAPVEGSWGRQSSSSAWIRDPG